MKLWRDLEDLVNTDPDDLSRSIDTLGRARYKRRDLRVLMLHPKHASASRSPMIALSIASSVRPPH